MAWVDSCGVLPSVSADFFRVTGYDLVAWNWSHETRVNDLYTIKVLNFLSFPCSNIYSNSRPQRYSFSFAIPLNFRIKFSLSSVKISASYNS